MHSDFSLKIYDQITRRLVAQRVAQRVAPAARVILSQTPSFRIDGNDGVLAAGIAVAVTMQLFVCTPETSHVGTNSAHTVLKTSPQENAHLTIYQDASGREKRSNE